MTKDSGTWQGEEDDSRQSPIVQPGNVEFGDSSINPDPILEKGKEGSVREQGVNAGIKQVMKRYISDVVMFRDSKRRGNIDLDRLTGLFGFFRISQGMTIAQCAITRNDYLSYLRQINPDLAGIYTNIRLEQELPASGTFQTYGNIGSQFGLGLFSSPIGSSLQDTVQKLTSSSRDFMCVRGLSMLGLYVEHGTVLAEYENYLEKRGPNSRTEHILLQRLLGAASGIDGKTYEYTINPPVFIPSDLKGFLDENESPQLSCTLRDIAMLLSQIGHSREYVDAAGTLYTRLRTYHPQLTLEGK